MRLIFLGPPGAGKGTQSQHICADFGIRQLSSGDLLRANMRDQTPLGLEVTKFMNNGELVPDSLIIDLIKDELSKPQYKKGFLLDGFPRTIPQAAALDSMLIKMNQKLDCVLVLEVPHELIISRLSLRRTDRKTGKSFHLIFNPPPADGDFDLYQREDDKEETIRNRLEIYESLTKPLIKYYSSMGLVHKINGVGMLEDVYDRISTVLDRMTKSNIY